MSEEKKRGPNVISIQRRAIVRVLHAKASTVSECILANLVGGPRDVGFLSSDPHCVIAAAVRKLCRDEGMHPREWRCVLKAFDELGPDFEPDARHS
jgi:hypothetical protein